MKNIKLFLIKFILFVGSKTFLGRGLSRKILIKFIEKILNTINFNRSKYLFKVNFYNFKIYFYADNQTGLKLYFQRNENKELEFLKRNIENDSWFIDIGSHIGTYTLNISNLNSKKKRIKTLSVEPGPISFLRLKENLNLLKKNNKYIKKRTIIVNSAIGNKSSYGYINTKVNYANVKILTKKDNKKNYFKKIKIHKIFDLIKKYKIKKIYCLKIDTEGFEEKIIRNFFKDLNIKYYPKVLIIEHNNEDDYYKIDKFIINNGYEINFTTNSNAIYKRINEKS